MRIQPVRVPFLLACVFLCCFTLCSCAGNESGDRVPLRLGMAPYQDLAMIVNIKPQGLEKKYRVSVELITMSWEDIVPAVASAGKTIDVGFAGFSEFLTKQSNLNQGADDPLIFIYPLYSFGSGSLVTFNPDVPTLTPSNINDVRLIKKFLSYKIGVYKNSDFEMLLFKLARRAGIPRSQLRFFDVPLNDALLAAQNQNLDIVPAGLIQLTEALKRGGRIVLNTETLGFYDLTGLVCKKSTWKARRKDIESLISMWFECVNFVFSDIDKNSKWSRNYLQRNTSTKYTLAQYKAALGREYFPRNRMEVSRTILSPIGKYSLARTSKDVSDYLIDTGVIKNPSAVSPVLEINK